VVLLAKQLLACRAATDRFPKRRGLPQAPSIGLSQASQSEAVRPSEERGACEPRGRSIGETPHCSTRPAALAVGTMAIAPALQQGQLAPPGR